MSLETTVALRSETASATDTKFYVSVSNKARYVMFAPGPCQAAIRAMLRAQPVGCHGKVWVSLKGFRKDDSCVSWPMKEIKSIVERSRR